MSLNKLQQKAFDAVIVDKVPILVLTGAGGVGKSHTTAAIIGAYGKDIAITATTNKAKEVLSQMAQRPANTVQSQMGFVITQHNYKQALKQVREPKCASLVIVEEISMLPLSVYEELLRNKAEGAISQLLFLGDPIQLKSIGEGVNPLDIPGLHIELTEQMRQSKEDIELATYLDDLRYAIEMSKNPPNFPTDTEAFKVITDHSEFAAAYKEATGVKKVIAYRNRVVDKYNEYIHDGEHIFNSGDTVVIDKPIGTARNGDTVQILSIMESTKYAALEIVIITGSGEVFKVLQWHSKSALEHVLIECKNTGNEEHYWAVHNSSFNLKHQYACTVHKSQGSSYDAVFIDGTDLWDAHIATPTKWNNPITMDDFLRLLYVAISRMRTTCYLYIGQQRKYEKFR